MKVLLCSTYELGHQPLGIAGPAAALISAGHDVETADLSFEPWPAEAISRAEAIVFSIPMHTATELAMQAAQRIADEGLRPPLAFIGLYASVLEDHPLLRPSDFLGAGETAQALERWLEQLSDNTARHCRHRSISAPSRSRRHHRRPVACSHRSIATRATSRAVAPSLRRASNRHEGATTAAGTARSRPSTGAGHERSRSRASSPTSPR